MLGPKHLARDFTEEAALKSLTSQIGYSEKAYTHLRESILRGELRPGHPISELEFSASLKMSRTPVREAIHRLIDEGVLVRLRGRGTFVRSISRDEVCSVYEYAEGLEGMVAFLVAQKYDSKFERRILEPVEAMEAQIEKSNGLGENEIAWAAADWRFHDSLYEICSNRIIVEGLKRVYAQIQLVRLGVSGVLLNRRKSTQDHRDTATAIIAGDAFGARATVQRHWERIRTDLMKGMV